MGEGVKHSNDSTGIFPGVRRGSGAEKYVAMMGVNFAVKMCTKHDE